MKIGQLLVLFGLIAIITLLAILFIPYAYKAGNDIAKKGHYISSALAQGLPSELEVLYRRDMKGMIVSIFGCGSMENIERIERAARNILLGVNLDDPIRLELHVGGHGESEKPDRSFRYDRPKQR
ncbi:MAG: hypothetical protein MI807_15675 [Verrucomicrobiales bacterium]|nr:hypothetical protein [Verrucomicrobiales bacterium]